MMRTSNVKDVQASTTVLTNYCIELAQRFLSVAGLSIRGQISKQVRVILYTKYLPCRYQVLGTNMIRLTTDCINRELKQHDHFIYHTMSRCPYRKSGTGFHVLGLIKGLPAILVQIISLVIFASNIWTNYSPAICFFPAKNTAKHPIWPRNSIHLNMIFTRTSKTLWKMTLREKYPNTEFFLVRIFPHSDWIRRDTPYYRDQKKSIGPFSRSVKNDLNLED